MKLYTNISMFTQFQNYNRNYSTIRLTRSKNHSKLVLKVCGPQTFTLFYVLEIIVISFMLHALCLTFHIIPFKISTLNLIETNFEI